MSAVETILQPLLRGGEAVPFSRWFNAFFSHGGAKTRRFGIQISADGAHHAIANARIAKV
jgi:hypothetical protein